MKLSGKIGYISPLLDDKGLITYRSFLGYRNHLFTYYRDADDPLTLHSNDGNDYRILNNFKTDGGSIYSFVNYIPVVNLDSFGFPRAYFMHDCVYQLGALEVRQKDNDVFELKELSRSKADDILLEVMDEERASPLEKVIIGIGVKLGGKNCWDPEKQRIRRKELGLKA